MSYNLIGQRLGRWIVIEEAPERKHGEKQYLCECQCGTRKVITSYVLRSGSSKSCGCLAREVSQRKIHAITPSPEDLTGQKFGRLTCIRLTDKLTWKHGAEWLCTCDCGNQTVVSAQNLKRGHTKSCGCLNIELYKYRASKLKGYTDHRAASVIGRRYGRLTIIGIGNDDYLCECDCGRKINVKKTLIYQSKSCGCASHSHLRKQMYKEVTGQTSDIDETVIFLDGDINHATPENLMSIPSAVYLQMLRDKMFTSDRELTRTAVMACTLAYESKKKNNDKSEF